MLSKIFIRRPRDILIFASITSWTIFLTEEVIRNIVLNSNSTDAARSVIYGGFISFTHCGGGGRILLGNRRENKRR